MFCFLFFPTPTNAHTFSCPMVLTTTVQQIPPSCTATGGVWAQSQALPSPSSLHPPHSPPPPPAPLARGHVPPQHCYQTTPTTAQWVPPWCLHHVSPAGRFVHPPCHNQHIFVHYCFHNLFITETLVHLCCLMWNTF